MTRDALREQGDEHSIKQANQNYFVISGRYFAFEQFDEQEKSSAAIITYEQLVLNKNTVEFDFNLFEMMFLKYGQVLDTDGDYLVVYSCQEVAQFFNEKTGLEMSEQDVWKVMMN